MLRANIAEYCDWLTDIFKQAVYKVLYRLFIGRDARLPRPFCRTDRHEHNKALFFFFSVNKISWLISPYSLQNAIFVDFYVYFPI